MKFHAGWWLVFLFMFSGCSVVNQSSMTPPENMEWKTLLAYITGTVDKELLVRNEYLVAENLWVSNS